MFTSIMVPLDGSAPAEQALRLADSIARQTAACIHLVHVRTGPSAFPAADAEVPGHTYVRAVAAGLRARGANVRCVVLEDELASVLPSNRPARSTADALLHYVGEHGIDLVAMSSHGRGGLRRVWLGSVADALLRRSPVPVLLARPLRRGAAATPDVRLHRVLLPLDGSRVAEQAIEPAIALAGGTGGHLVLLQCVEPLRPPVNPFVHWVLPPFDTILEQQLREARACLNCLAERLRGRSLTVQIDVVLSPAVPGILRAIRRHEIDVVAMATHGAGGATRLLLGSVADRVVRTAAVPVMTVRSGKLEPEPVSHGCTDPLAAARET